MPRTEYNDPEAEKHFQSALSKDLVTDEPNETYVAKSTPGKGDKFRNQTKREDRYGDGYGPNQNSYRARRDAED